MLTLADVLEALTGHRLNMIETVINEAAIDSRQVIPGSMFVALPGERTDGHNYVADAFKNGASLALVQNRICQPSSPPSTCAAKPNLAEMTLPSSVLHGTRSACGSRTPCRPYNISPASSAAR